MKRPWLERLRAALLTTGLLLLAACGGGNGGAPAPTPTPTPAPTPGLTAPVSATVYDTFGRFVAGASVTTGAGTAVTDAGGRATVPLTTGGEQTVRIARDGFAEQVKVLTLPSGSAGTSLQVMLIERAAPKMIAAVEAGGTASGLDGVRVTFPPSALVNASGQAVTGTVELLMTPVNVTNVDISAFPGLFEGVPSGGVRSGIVSYGTAELVPQQGGQKLQLAGGKTAEIELPLYATKHQDGRAVTVGDSVPLWSLQSASGLWLQEGSGTVISSTASPTGLAVRATISHFSWWNLDAVAERGSVTVSVTASSASPAVPAGTIVQISATVVAGTGPTSTATENMAVGETRTFTLPATVTTRLVAESQANGQHCRGSADVSVAPNATGSVVIDMTCVTVPTPTLVDPTSITVTNSASPLLFMITLDRPTVDSVELLVNGVVAKSFSPQFFYRDYLDTATLAEGTHVLRPRATVQGVSRTGNDVQILVDRTAPQMTAFAPVTSTAVDRDTVFTVDFDEPVNPLPFTLADAVKLSVLTPGQSAPVVVPADITLDTAGRRLTVRPTAVLPQGTASLTWGGLQDAARNAVAGTIAASWPVSRVTRLGSDILFDADADVGLVATGGGQPVVLHRLTDNATLQVLTFDGSTFVPLPTPNERSASRSASLAIAVDDTVYVAFEQLALVGSASEVVVRRFDAATNAWQTLGTPFPTGRAFPPVFAGTPTEVTLDIDPAGRPVLLYVDNSNFTAQAHRFQGGAWAALGSLGASTFGIGGLAFANTGDPVVALRQNTPGGDQLLVKGLGAGGWSQIGAALDTSVPNSSVRRLRLAVDAAGLPWVAWHKSGVNVNLARLDAGTQAFVAVAIDPPLPTYNWIADVAFVGGEPVVAGGRQLGQGLVDVRRLHAGQWEAPALMASPGLHTDVRLAPAGNELLVAMPADNPTPARLRVSRLVFP